MEEKKLTDEEIVKALMLCGSKDYCEQNCEYRLARLGAECIPKMMKQALELIRRLQKEKEQLEATVKIHLMDIDDLHAEREKRVEAVYADFMLDYRIMREELNELNAHAVELNRENEQLVKEKRLLKDMNAELQEQATKTYNKGFDRGVKAAVDKMRAYLPPRDVDRYPDAVPQHWQLDEVLRQLTEDK